MRGLYPDLVKGANQVSWWRRHAESSVSTLGGKTSVVRRPGQSTCAIRCGGCQSKGSVISVWAHSILISAPYTELIMWKFCKKVITLQLRGLGRSTASFSLTPRSAHGGVSIIASQDKVSPACRRYQRKTVRWQNPYPDRKGGANRLR